MASIPTPLRAALGLVANVIDGARTLPSKAVDLPVMAVSTALQVSLRAQQRYAELAMRGDEVLSLLRPPPEEPPSWATFDDEQADESVSAEAEPVSAEAEPVSPEAETVSPEAEPVSPEAETVSAEAETVSAEAETVSAEAEMVSAEAERPDEPVSAEAERPDEPVAPEAAAPRGGPARATAKRTGKTVRAPRQVAPSAFDAADGSSDLPDGAVSATQLPVPGSTPEE